MFYGIKNSNIFAKEITIKTHEAMNLSIPTSVENRAIDFILNGMEPLEAIKKALEVENNLISEIIERRTDRSKVAAKVICNRVYKSLKK